MRQFSLFILSVVSGIWILHAQIARKYSNEFLNIGVDAAAMGMGNTVVSTVSDVTAGYWNPAGLTGVHGYQGALMHAAWFANIAQYDYAGFAMPLSGKNSMGVSLLRFGVDDIMDTTQLIDSNGNIDYSRIHLFSAADYALIFSFARKDIMKQWDLGVNTKIIHRRIGDFATSFGFGFDLGIRKEKGDWSYGLMLRDVTTTFNSWNIDEDKLQQIQEAIPGENQSVPEKLELSLPKAQLGISRHWGLTKDISMDSSLELHMRFSKTQDLVHSDFVSFSPALGLQADYMNIAFVRLGVNNMQQVVLYDDTQSISWQPNMGAGFRYRGVQIDYALTNLASLGNALYSHVFSIKIDFDSLK